MHFDLELKQKMETADRCLKTFLPQKECPEVIFGAIEYSLFAKGKRLRPILLMTAYEALGGTDDRYMPFAAAIEMIHTYSLIHDDLPAMDDDDYRRGIPTNHKVFGEANAILAGDALLNLAYEVMIKAIMTYNDLSPVKAMEQIAAAAGIHGMIKGQVLDMMYENKPCGKETLHLIHKNKTAALLSASLGAGGHLAGAPLDTVRRLTLAGENLGIAFQIRDDILDVCESFENTGKPSGSDEKNNKSTYISLYGLEHSKEMVIKYSKDAENIINGLTGDFYFLKELIYYLINRSN